MEQLVARICVDFGTKLIKARKSNTDIDDFVKEFTKVYFDGKSKCNALTTKGSSCNKFACDGEQFCSMHLKKSKKPKKTKTTTVKKTLSHNHGITSPAIDCKLCSMHGEVFKIPEYEIIGDL